MKKWIVILCIVGLTGISCNKSGVGGKAAISGAVAHHETAVPGAVVYIKYGAVSFPGFDPELYDDQITVSGANASYTFGNLYKGDYYVWAVGYDSTIMESVSAGVPAEILKKKVDIVVNIPVTE